jgi:predicted secreted protein
MFITMRRILYIRERRATMRPEAFLKRILIVLTISLLASVLCMQEIEGVDAPPIEWSKTYGGTGLENARCMIQTSDGGYALAGDTESFGAGNKDFWLVKTDASGNMEWNQTYGGVRAEIAFSVVETSDGGYALAGRTRSFGAAMVDCWLVKVDSSGNQEWRKSYGGAGIEAARSVVETSDGGYALAGFTESFGAGGEDFWLVKVDAAGNHEWNKTYGGAGNEGARSVVETSDGGYALAGETGSFGAGDVDFWLVKVDAAGNHEWNKTYGAALADGAFSVVETSDGGYALAGYTRSFGASGSDFWLVKVDAAGNHEWNKTYGGAGNDPAHSLVETSVVEAGDGGYALAGFTVSFGEGGQDGWLIETDADGNMDWNQTYGGSGNDVLNSVVETADGGLALAGFTESFGAGNQDFWLIKVAHAWEYTFAVDSSPTGIMFTVDGGSNMTPWLGAYEDGSSVSLEMPETHVVGDSEYYWSQWSDGNTSRSRTIIVDANITLTAQYTGPYYELTVISSPITGVPFTVNGGPQTTSYSDWLLGESYTILMPETHNGYVWSHWLEDGDTNRVKTVALAATTTCTAVYSIPVGGTTISVESGLSANWTAAILTIASAFLAANFILRRKFT